MTERLGVWIAGLAVGAACSLAVSVDLFPAVRVVVFASAFVLTGLLGGPLLVWSRRKAGEPPSPPQDARPPDGRVDVARLATFLREPNPFDPRFGRYTGREPGDEVAPGPRSDRPALHGRVVVVSLFLGRDGRSWSDREIAGVHEALFRAGEWVEREALRYGAAVNLELADTYFVADDEMADEVEVGFAPEENGVGPWEGRASAKALARVARAAVGLGFPDAVRLIETVEGRAQADATVWLLHPRQAGRSFALPREDAGLGLVSLAVCYPREAAFPGRLSGPLARADPVTVAHELLHLFGATDKYGRPLAAYPTGSVTPREVMRLSFQRLSRLRIDPATAREIGWASPVTLPS